MCRSTARPHVTRDSVGADSAECREAPRLMRLGSRSCTDVTSAVGCGVDGDRVRARHRERRYGRGRRADGAGPVIRRVLHPSEPPPRPCGTVAVRGAVPRIFWMTCPASCSSAHVPSRSSSGPATTDLRASVIRPRGRLARYARPRRHPGAVRGCGLSDRHVQH